jgi:vacuolar-type H+-ATPase subunit C/Vma6
MRVWKYAFVQAKIQGMFAKTFLGERLRQVLRLRRVSEIFSVLFPGEPMELPERETLALIERRIITRNIDTVLKTLSYIDDPPRVLVQMLRRYEYRSVKSLIRRAASKERPADRWWDIGPYRTVEYDPERPLESLLADTPFEWIIAALGQEPLYRIESRLDRQYYEELLSAIDALPNDERRPLEELVSFEILLQNLVWTLRLMVYFRKSREEAEELLVPGPDGQDLQAILAPFEFSRDSVQDWSSWKYSWLIRNQLSDDFRNVNPAEAEHTAIRLLFRRCRKLFHAHPFTVVPVYCFLMLKNFEAEFLQSAIEGIRISASESELEDLLGGM